METQSKEAVKHHRRMSSVYVPIQPPMLDRTAQVFVDAISPIQSRFGVSTSSNADGNEREVVPNFLFDPSIPHYKLFNRREYSNNKIATTKYNLFTFIPKNIYEQFHRIANVYFISIALLNWIPVLQAFNRFVGMIPVILILALTALKDAYEDFRRRRLDKRINGTHTHVWDISSKRFRKIEWQHLIVGDFVHVSLDEVIPADLLLLRSSDTQGICYVETSNLDGETNMKQRRVPCSLTRFSGEEVNFTPTMFEGKVICEKPNKLIYQMKGRLIYENGSIEQVSRDNMILRGCKLKNTTFVEGIVLYAGNDTKAMMNSARTRYKRSSLELITNRFIIYCVFILIFLCLFAGITRTFWLMSFSQCEVSFAALITKSPITDGIINSVSSILNYQQLIPLSLYISVELVKLGQIYFITQDRDLYYEKTDRAMECRSLNIPEELGQIEYLLTDKTGTLTENQMVFRCCSIAGIDYESNKSTKCNENLTSNPAENVAINEELKAKVYTEWKYNTNIFDFLFTMVACNTVVVNKFPRVDAIDDGYIEDGLYVVANSAFIDSVQVTSFNRPPKTEVARAKNPQFVIEELNETGNSVNELRFINEDFRVISNSLIDVLDETNDSTQIQLQVEKEKSKSTSMSRVSSIGHRIHGLSRRIPSDLIAVRSRLFEFMRQKRKFEPEDEPAKPLYEAESPDELALVYAAKAYGFILSKKSPDSVEISLPGNAQQNVQILKILPFDSIRKKMSILVNKEGENILYTKGADTEIINSLSRSFVDSCSGAEIISRTQAKLQQYSCQGLRTLCLAKRVISQDLCISWMAKYSKIENDLNNVNQEDDLLNCKQEIEKDMTLLGATAIEDRLQDGVSETIASLREAQIQVWLLTGDKMETAINIARSCGLFPQECQVCMIETENDVQTVFQQLNCNIKVPTCLVLSSKSLSLFQQGDEMLIEVIKRSLSVLCYRLAPSSKAEIVRFVKKLLKGKVLAVGDGANDVPMIQRADVGIGISGQEGMQAVMAADFAIARFRFLCKLLLVHGHWCYQRLINLFLFFFMKNTALCFVIFWCQLFNGFSSNIPMDEIYMMSYQIIFTGVQPLVFGIYDQIAHRNCLMEHPYLYSEGRTGMYGSRQFWLNILDGLWQSTVIYFIAHITYWDTDISCNYFGFLLSSSIFFCNNINLAIQIRCWTAPIVIIFLFFSSVHFAYFVVEEILVSPSWNLKDIPVNILSRAMSTKEYWAALLISVLLSTFPRFFIYVLRNSIMPTSLFLEVSRKN